MVLKKFSERAAMPVLMMALGLAPMAKAQVRPSTTGGGGSVVVGAEASLFKPDSLPAGFVEGYTASELAGVGFFFDVDLKPRWGMEGEANWLNYHGSQGEKQQHYLLGPRYRVYRWHSASAFVKFMMGAGREVFPDQVGRGSYFAFGPGVTLDYQLTSRIDVRADYEYLDWPQAPNLGPGVPNNGMHPQGVSIGIGYRLLNAQK
jgi:opacity protein-like surface antigen